MTKKLGKWHFEVCCTLFWGILIPNICLETDAHALWLRLISSSAGVLLQWLVSIFCFVLAMTWWWDVLRKFNIRVELLQRWRGGDDLAFFGKAYQGLKESITPRAAQRHQQLWQTITKAQCQEESRPNNMITNNLDDYHDIKHEFAYNQFQELTQFQLNLKCNKNCRILNGPLRVRKWSKNGSKKVQKLSKNGQEMVLKWSWNGPEMVQ